MDVLAWRKAGKAPGAVPFKLDAGTKVALVPTVVRLDDETCDDDKLKKHKDDPEVYVCSVVTDNLDGKGNAKYQKYASGFVGDVRMAELVNFQEH